MTNTLEAAPQLPADHPINVLLNWEESPLSDQLVSQVIFATTDLRAEEIGAGQAAHELIELHEVVRTACSERFATLRAENPGTEKVTLNADPNLMALNFFRRTLHQSFVRRQKEAVNPRKMPTISKF